MCVFVYVCFQALFSDELTKTEYLKKAIDRSMFKHEVWKQILDSISQSGAKQCDQIG